MKDDCDQLLDERQMKTLRMALHGGSVDASEALAKWMGRPSVVEIDSLEQLAIEDVSSILSSDNSQEPQAVGFCSMEIHGLLTGQMILLFDDASGRAVADMLLENRHGQTQEWTELAVSAVTETTNILCCAYLSSLATVLPLPAGESKRELLPAPPNFNRDFPESVLEFALMGQAIASDQVLLAVTRFEIDGAPLNWTMLLIPDGSSMSQLRHLLPRAPSTTKES